MTGAMGSSSGFVPGRKNDCMGVIAQELEEAGAIK